MSSSRFALFIALSFSTACEATLVSGHNASGTDSVEEKRAELGVLASTRKTCDSLGDGVHAGPAPIRRLTRAEYNATTSELAKQNIALADEFPAEARALGFHGVADAQSVTLLLVEGYQTAAKALALKMTEDTDGLLGCSPSSEQCVRDFVTEFGAQAYRRPLTDQETDRLMAVFAWGRDNQTPVDGVQMVLEVLLQSPDFLYRPEFGGEEVEPGVVKLTPHELAVRLSYLFLGSLPDAGLQNAVREGRLETAEDVLREAERLLQSERVRETVRSFHSQWLDLEGVRHLERDPKVYPGFDDDIPDLLVEETESFVEHVVFEGDGSLKSLLTADFTMANQRLAEFYGLPTPSGDGFEVVATDGRRRGLLTHGSLLAHHAQPLSTSPVHRGKFIREAILCQLLQPPPADLVIVPPELDPNLTTRERFAQHSQDPGCSGCHELMDPVGLGFEQFDSVGRWRDTENGFPVDGSGELIAADVAGEFSGASELAEMLGSSDEVASCMVRNWMRFAHGRSETPEDSCSMVELGGVFAENNYDIQTLMLNLTQTDAFLYREVAEQ